MASSPNKDLVDRFLRFYRNYYRDEIGQLAQRYPNEQRSLHIDYDDLYQFDPDLAEDYLAQPDQLGDYAEEALRVYDLPADVSLGQAHVRLRNLPDSVDIRSIRVHDNHVGRMIAVSGIIRKATDVRPKITEAAFECQRCGTMTYIPQTDGGFQEPHECQGCERQGPFRVNYDQSEFVDSQKLRVQESPEGLRGGETPQSIDIDIEDDITGKVTAGDHVTVTGILHIDQVTEGNEKSQLFDLYMDGVSVVIEDEQFEDMEISEADKREIIELSNHPDIYDEMVASVAPSIYGYDEEKLAMILQLFSGVTKTLPDGSRIRGDLHMLLIGDPGTGKSQMLSYIRNIAPRSVYTSGKGSSSAGLCVTGDTLLHTADGFTPIRELAEPHHPEPVATESSKSAEYDLYTFDRANGEMTQRTSSHVWRMPEKQCRRIETAHGKELETSTNTPVLVCGDDGIEWSEMADIETGDFVAVPKYDDIDRSTPSPRAFFEFSTEKLKPTEESVAFLRQRLRERFGTLRNAAAELELTEDFIYDSLSNRHLPLSRLDRILDAIDADRSDIDVARSMLGHGNSHTIPDSFDADLMYLVGLVFGDGDIMVSRRGGNRGHVRISNSDEELLREAERIVEETFDKSVEIERQDERVPCVRIHSATIARFFRNLGMESPKGDLGLDPQLTTAEHADAFLRGLFDADGSVSARDDGGSSIQFSTISDEFARQVQLMLEMYGVRARRRERDRRGTYELENGHEIESKAVQTHLTMYGQHVDTFAERIGFESTAKTAALRQIVGDAERRGERLPVGNVLATAGGPAGAYYQNIRRGDNPSRERARAMLAERDLGAVEPSVREAVDASLVWDKVVDAVDTGTKELFDLTVPETNNFVGNGIITHNTAAAVRDDFGEGQQWSLEAGALVLADQGIAAVDELDKMRCVTGDTLVHLADGSIRRIEELARDAAETGSVETLDNGRTIRGTDFDVWTMADDGRIVSRPVSAVHEYEAPDTLTEVRLETGERLTATNDHPFFVFDEGERVERAASELSPDDWVYVPRTLSQSVADGGSVTVDANQSIRSPEITPALGAVLGYLSGDGNVFYDRDHGTYGIRFTNTEAELLADFERVCRSAFDAEPIRAPSEQRADGVETVRVSGRDVADTVLDAGMNLQVYDGKAFPKRVADGSSAVKAAFVRALADSEGTVDTETGNVRIHSASYELLLGTKQLLLEFGVSSQIQTRERDNRRDLYVLTITAAESLRAFGRQIGFVLDRKASALETVRADVSGDRTIIDVIPNCGEQLATLRDSLRLYQRECGIKASTYCAFENGDANVSLRLGREILDAFERRRQTATTDVNELRPDTDWEQIEALIERYHVTQSELASRIDGRTQQAISRDWGTESLRSRLIGALRGVLRETTQADLTPLRELVYGDVKWRRVADVRGVDREANDVYPDRLDYELADRLGCDAAQALAQGRRLLANDPAPETWNELRDVVDRYDIALTDLARDLDVSASTLSRWSRGVVETDRFDAVREVALDRVHAVRAEVRNLVEEIDDRTRDPRVYDLTVDGTHNFVANGMVVHNSEDRSAMHQALEQQEISISKAGINATLKSRCSLLGAANPKYGRFDQYEPIGEQIDLEPALISRFDLIFTVTDQPDPDEDAALAEHILQTNYAGELETQRTQVSNPEFTREEVASVTDTVEPAIDPDLLRKYIAYAKRTCFPTMADDAKESIRDFYVDLRAKGADEDAPVPVTARKLEALVRLAEASARVRLSDTVEREDATRATDIVRSCLQDIGVDPETGEFDADVIETGTSKSQRDRIKSIKDVIETVDAEYEGEAGAPIDAIVERAEVEGIDEEKVMDQIEQLRRKGDLYSPKQDQYKVV